MKIIHVTGREIYDSRGWPTIACDIVLEDGTIISASVPSGISRGRHEARELRDGGKRLWGQGVLKAVENLEQMIAPVLIGEEPRAIELDLKLLELDNTTNKSNLGANAMLAASMALYRAQAHCEKIELYELIAYACGAEMVSMPFPLFNVINGGLHAQNQLVIQEFMVMPVGFPSFHAAMEYGVILFHELKSTLQKRGKQIVYGEEGGYAPPNLTDEEALEILTETLERVGDETCMIALDVAATRLYDPSLRRYVVRGRKMSSDALIAWYKNLAEQYPICSIEDGLHEDDWDGWRALTSELSEQVQIVGDDLFVTNAHRIAEGIATMSATAAVIKPNQIGTVTEALQAIRLCKSGEFNIIVSHRSGETDDSFIADLSVGASSGQIKAGGLTRGERLAKYNRLLEIEDQLSYSADS